ncbi:MAG: trigger factor [Actinomycetota bacterium]
MQSTIEETDKHKVKLTIEVAPDEFGTELDAAYKRIAEQVKIPGFRKGKIPRKVIDAQVGRDAVMQEFLTHAVSSYYSNAVREHDLAPISDPDIAIDDVEIDKPLKFTAELEVRPRPTIEDYKGIEVTKPKIEVTEPDVDEYIEHLRNRFAELEVVGRGAKQGDFVLVDIRGSVHGEEVPDASRLDYLYEIGSGEVLPGLDKELEGKRKGEILKFNAKLPETFGDDAGKEVSFQVLIKEVKGKKLPPTDDDFAKTASEFDTLEELRADVKEKLKELKGREADAEVRELVLQNAIEKVDVELPDKLVDAETEHRVHTARERAERAGTTLEAVLQEQGWDELRLRSDARTHAVRAIKADLVLESVARQEELKVTAEELAAEVSALAQALGRDPKDLAKTLEETGQITSLAGDIIRSKALDLLVEHAKVASEGEQNE